MRPFAWLRSQQVSFPKIRSARMIEPTGRPSSAEFERWGFVTDP